MIAAIIRAVGGRLEADTGTGGLFASAAELVSGVYWEIAPPDVAVAMSNPTVDATVKPYIVMSGADRPDDTQRGEGLLIDLELTIIAPRDKGPTAMQAIAERIYGDAAAQGGSPSYGLHRWTVGAIVGSSWRASIMDYRGADTIADLTTIGLSLRYGVRLQLNHS